MKTIKIILSIAGVALTTICFGQLLSQNSSEVLFYSAHYDTSTDRFEHWVHSYPERTTSGDQFDAPVLAKTYYLPLESDMILEPWMTSPFESSYYEEDMQIETWMVEPFESSYYEEDMQIETWMVEPFESSYYEEDMQIETWMVEPFESSYHEEDMQIETWMVEPFESSYHEAELVIESWMTTPF